jgi:hypothetical protein
MKIIKILQIPVLDYNILINLSPESPEWVLEYKN